MTARPGTQINQGKPSTGNKGAPGSAPVIKPRSFGMAKRIAQARAKYTETVFRPGVTQDDIDADFQAFVSLLGTLIERVPEDWLMPDAPTFIDWTKLQSWEDWVIDVKVKDLIGAAAGDAVQEDAKNSQAPSN